ncbi:ferritin-like domain-containing protein [Tunturiibacter lichenicola]|uniref:ferritin-like domain-containing protein n=1 Tax=Tunturiibacter lichenicola TaxID=2051959 RepID=UPI003D9BD64B
MEKKLNDLIDKALSRRKFLAGAGTATASALIVGCSSSSPAPTPTPTPTPTPLDVPDNDILNFALNLEYLEAEFYLYAATGHGLSTADALTGAGTTIVPPNIAAVPWANSTYAQYANEIAQDELNHVRLIQSAITANSGTPVPRPALDLTFFAPLAVAAGITTTPTFNPFDGTNDFLIGAFVFEDVGVTAYSGAAPLLTNNNILSAAAGIQAVEAYHAAEIRTLIVGTSIATNDQTYIAIANKVSALRGMLGGGNETALSVSSIVAADPTNAIAFHRTTDQVLHIVYGAAGGAGLGKGGFFPNGLNGKISVTAS